MTPAVAFIAGMFVGGFLGLLGAALCVAASRIAKAPGREDQSRN